MPQTEIKIRGAREHNLKNIDLAIPRDKFVVITGLSGSGKSSLAFDTIYAEGQRRYIESLSSYARMFLGQMDKPDVDSIDGLSPAVSIEQKTTSKNPRSTVGTTTEIYDYLRLLYARCGIPHCPVCGREIKAQTTDQIADEVMKLGDGERAVIMAPVVTGKKGEYTSLFSALQKSGFARVRIDGQITRLEGDPIRLNKQVKHFIDVVVDRIILRSSSTSRVAEAVETATRLADGRVLVQVLSGADMDVPEQGRSVSSGAKGAKVAENEYLYSTALACPEHGFSMDHLEPRDFSFNAPYGACPDCLGIGYREQVDPDLMVPDTSLSLRAGAIAPFKNGNYYPQVLQAVARAYGQDADTPWEDLSDDARHALMFGCGNQRIRVDYHTIDGRDTYWYIQWEGAVEALSHKYAEADTDSKRERIQKYVSNVPCKTCGGKRLKPEILAVTLGDRSIYEVCNQSAASALDFFKSLEFSGQSASIAKPIVKEILARLQFMVDVGLDYLTLERTTATLSGGEAQRIRLATQIGAGLMGVLYILDEPSIGLHQRDNARLISTLEHLRDLGNTVIVVEHDEETIRAADYVIDMGPCAGEQGGEICAIGSPAEIEKSPGSLTGDYLSGKLQIPTPEHRRHPRRGKLKLTGARENNLQNVTLEIPLGTFTVITGVSGSGKSSLITDTLAPLLANRLNHAHRRCGPFKTITGLDKLDKAINIDQSPIGRTPRSNPATYIGLWDDIRSLFASCAESKIRGYSAGRFSFNVSGGRCEACKGDGQIKIEMHFLPDIYVPCDVCHGKRYNRETLQVTYRGKNIADVLEMTVDEALGFFEHIPQIARKLKTLYDVGLRYICLGQSATTLSGGEAQRVKLASELHRRSNGRTFYILDEPTTGLHFEDVRQLLEVLQRLVDAGNTVCVIEHNLDVIKNADYIVDLGPEGGERGGRIIASGTPEQVAKTSGSYTGEFLARILGAK